MALIAQPISNHPMFQDVTRIINIVSETMNADTKTLDLPYRISYYKNNQDITSIFNIQTPLWQVNNDQRMMVRDENFNPIPSPDFVEQKDEQGNVINENEKFLTMPAFDYIKMLMFEKNVPLPALIQAYIIEEDADGRFNF